MLAHCHDFPSFPHPIYPLPFSQTTDVGWPVLSPPSCSYGPCGDCDCSTTTPYPLSSMGCSSFTVIKPSNHQKSRREIGFVASKAATSAIVIISFIIITFTTIAIVATTINLGPSVASI